MSQSSGDLKGDQREVNEILHSTRNGETMIFAAERLEVTRGSATHPAAIYWHRLDIQYPLIYAVGLIGLHYSREEYAH